MNVDAFEGMEADGLVKNRMGPPRGDDRGPPLVRHNGENGVVLAMQGGDGSGDGYLGRSKPHTLAAC